MTNRPVSRLLVLLLFGLFLALPVSAAESFFVVEAHSGRVLIVQEARQSGGDHPFIGNVDADLA